MCAGGTAADYQSVKFWNKFMEIYSFHLIHISTLQWEHIFMDMFMQADIYNLTKNIYGV